MSYLVWKIDHDAIRTACIESALFQCGWDADDTLGELIEALHHHNYEEAVESTDTFNNFIEFFTACPIGKHLFQHANKQMAEIYQNAPPPHDNGKWISVEEIITSKFDVEEWFDEMNY